MAKYIKRTGVKPLTPKQKGEAGKLGLTFDEWRWYDAIRKTRGEGVQWGCLPRGVFQTLVRKTLIKGSPVTLWAAEFAPPSRQS